MPDRLAFSHPVRFSRGIALKSPGYE